jgi:hypothetical protein
MIDREKEPTLTFDQQMPLWRLGALLARTEEKSDRTAIKRLMNTKRLHYRLGWNAASIDRRLASAEDAKKIYLLRHGEALVQDFLYGYDDHLHERGFGHLEQCPDHAAGTCDPLKGSPGLEEFI